MAVENKSGYLTKQQIEFYNEEGYIVLDRLLSNDELAPAQEAMTYKVSMIADELFRDGLIEDKLVERPFKYRLAELFEHLTAEEFLKYGRSWRDRITGYFHLMSNGKILNAVESLMSRHTPNLPRNDVKHRCSNRNATST